MPKRYLSRGHRHSVAWEGEAQVHFGPGGVKFRQECECGWWRWRFVSVRGPDAHGEWQPSREHAGAAMEADYTARQRRVKRGAKRNKIGPRKIAVPGTDIRIEVHDSWSNLSTFLWGGTPVTVTLGGEESEEVETTLAELYQAAEANPGTVYEQIATVLPRIANQRWAR